MYSASDCEVYYVISQSFKKNGPVISVIFSSCNLENKLTNEVKVT